MILIKKNNVWKFILKVFTVHVDSNEILEDFQCKVRFCLIRFECYSHRGSIPFFTIQPNHLRVYYVFAEISAHQNGDFSKGGVHKTEGV